MLARVWLEQTRSLKTNVATFRPGLRETTMQALPRGSEGVWRCKRRRQLQPQMRRDEGRLGYVRGHVGASRALPGCGELALLVRVCDVVAGQTSRWQVRAAISCICLSRWGEAQRATKSLPRLEPPPPEKGGPQKFRNQTYRLGTDGGKKGWRKRGGANREAYAKKFAHLPRGTSKSSAEWKAAATAIARCVAGAGSGIPRQV